jgi:hypothetical protein
VAFFLLLLSDFEFEAGSGVWRLKTSCKRDAFSLAPASEMQVRARARVFYN